MPSPFLDNLSDIQLTNTIPGEGDVIISNKGDFAFITGPQAVQQGIWYRLMTTRGDWKLQPLCGASLENYFGQINSSDLISEIEADIVYALTHDGFIAPSDLDVVITPINISQIAIYVSVPVNGVPVNFVGGIDLREGQLLLT